MGEHEAVTDSVNILDALNNPANIQGDLSVLADVFEVDDLRTHIAGLAEAGLRVIYLLEAGEGSRAYTVYTLMVLPETIAAVTQDRIVQSIEDLKVFLEKNMPQDGSVPPFDGAEAIRTMLVMELIRLSEPDFDASKPVPEKRQPIQAILDRAIPAGNVLVMSCLEDERGVCLHSGYLVDGTVHPSSG